MAFGPRRGYSDFIRGGRARYLVLPASEFANLLERPLNVAVDIDWSKTSAGDDMRGALFALWRKRAARFLRERGAGGLTCIWVRECAPSPALRPTAHLNCHVPIKMFDRFVKRAHRFFPPGCVANDAEAIVIEAIGTSGRDYWRRMEFLLKGAHPKARLPLRDKRTFRGRIYGKRCGTSGDISLGSLIKRVRRQDKPVRRDEDAADR